MPPPTRAVVTMVHNEAEFLPIWLRYYSRFFDADDIYVLDHDSDDGSTAAGGFNRIPVSNSETDWDWHVRTIEAKQHELLERYDVVLVCDVDELIVPDPIRLGDLGRYIDRFDLDFVSAIGYEIIHVPALEPPLDRSASPMAQRKYWFHAPAYNKTLLCREPAEWNTGFHRRADGHFRLDPDLRLIHLHRVDYGVCLARHRRLADRRWSRRDIELDHAPHNRLVEDEPFEDWYFGESGLEGFVIKVEEIPELWRSSVP